MRVTIVAMGLCVCVCMSVCQSGQDKLLRSLTPAGYGANSLYIKEARFKTCGFH